MYGDVYLKYRIRYVIFQNLRNYILLTLIIELLLTFIPLSNRNFKRGLVKYIVKGFAINLTLP